MNYNFSEITYPSKDGKNTVYACLYTPKHCTAKGIVQLVHGMVDYVERYEELANFLTGEGYIFAGNHHLGHGKTAANSDDFGFFGEDSSIDILRYSYYEQVFERCLSNVAACYIRTQYGLFSHATLY